MRRFLALAIITALGAWALKRLAEVGNDNACCEGMPQFSDEEEDLQSQTVDDLGDELTPSPSDQEIVLESQPAASVVDESPLSSDEEEDLQSQTVDDFRANVIPGPWEEEVHLESQPAEPSVSDGVEIQGPPDLDQWPKAGDDWSLPVGPNGDKKLSPTRAGVHDRFRNLLHRHKRDGRAAA